MSFEHNQFIYTQSKDLFLYIFVTPGRTVNKHTLICIMLSGQYFSISASNNSTGLQLCLWREKIYVISVVMILCDTEYTKKRIRF